MDPSSEPIPDYLRPWFPTQEDYDATIDYIIDARLAWLHFEPLWTSLGYTICYGDEDDCKPRRALVDQNAAVDPFHPTPTGAFVHSVPDRFESVLAKSAIGWKATSPRVAFAYDSFNRLVVIKAFLKSSEASELDIITYLNSPELRSSFGNHTIPVLGLAEEEGWQFVIMPAWNMNCTPFFVWQIDDYLEMVIQTFEGLAFMHEHGVAHRDISVTNITFNQDGTHHVSVWDVHPVISTWNVRLAFIDFGISKKFSTETDSKTWVTSECSGPGMYMAPEVAATEDTPADYQVLPADVYALGAVWRRWLDWENDIIRAFKTNSNLRTVEVPAYACQVLEKHVPEFMQLLGEVLDTNPTDRPTASTVLSRFRAIRDNIPANIRFAPPGGYPVELI